MYYLFEMAIPTPNTFRYIPDYTTGS